MAKQLQITGHTLPYLLRMTRKHKEFFLQPSHGSSIDGTSSTTPAATDRSSGHFTDLSDERTPAEITPGTSSPHQTSPPASPACASPAKARMRLDWVSTSGLVSQGETPSIPHNALFTSIDSFPTGNHGHGHTAQGHASVPAANFTCWLY